jgi:hypothetical protein
LRKRAREGTRRLRGGHRRKFTKRNCCYINQRVLNR